jgi:hypothetical protein
MVRVDVISVAKPFHLQSNSIMHLVVLTTVLILKSSLLKVTEDKLGLG